MNSSEEDTEQRNGGNLSESVCLLSCGLCNGREEKNTSAPQKVSPSFDSPRNDKTALPIGPCEPQSSYSLAYPPSIPMALVLVLARVLALVLAVSS